MSSFYCKPNIIIIVISSNYVDTFLKNPLIYNNFFINYKLLFEKIQNLLYNLQLIKIISNENK